MAVVVSAENCDDGAVEPYILVQENWVKLTELPEI